MDGINKYSKLEHIETDPRNIKIDFNEFSKIQIKVKEIYNCEITGTFSVEKGVFHGNIVMSSLNGFKGKNADLNKVDWKDSNLRDCFFENSSFDLGAVINCHYTSCSFNNCHFDNMSITGSVFYETEFINCDLSHMVIESCQFFNCTFKNCKTSNKIFEHCLMFDCTFIKSDIQLQTIIENFGLEKSQFNDCNIRSTSIDEDFKTLSYQEIQEINSTDSTIPNFYKFKIEYFLNPDITISGSVLFDNIFLIGEWLPLCKAQTTFVNLFKLFHDFLIILFEHNRTPLFTIYKLKELTGWISNHEAIKNNFELYPAMIGYDVGLARMIGQTNLLIKNTCKNFEEKITLLVEGPLDNDYYYNYLKKCVNGDFQITKVVKQNSPNILEIVAISSVIVQVAALFFVTRVKVELSKKKKKKKEGKEKKDTVKLLNETKNPYQIIKFENTGKEEDILQLYFSKSLDFHVNYSEYKSEDLGKIRKIVIDVYNTAS